MYVYIHIHIIILGLILQARYTPFRMNQIIVITFIYIIDIGEVRTLRLSLNRSSHTKQIQIKSN